MRLTTLLVCLVFSLAGAWGILELAETTETDWFGLPKLLVAIVICIVFFLIGFYLLRTVGCERSRRRDERTSRPEENEH